MNPEAILHLLQIMDLAKQWPEFQAIHDVARAELLEANDEAKSDLTHRAKSKAQADAKAKVEQAETTFSSDAGAPPAVDRRL